MEIISNYINALLIGEEELEKQISHQFGIHAIVSISENRMYIGLSHHESCFTLMKKLRWNFDYSVHKKGEIYIIEIPKEIKKQNASYLFNNSKAHLL